MKKINTYEIHMRLNNRMTQLPDSQKIFGTLVYLYAGSNGQEKTTKLVASVENQQWYCALSNMLPKGYLPAPASYLLEKNSQKAEKKEIYQAIKKIEYIKKADLEDIITQSQDIRKYQDYAHTNKSQQIHAAIDSLHYQLPGLPSNLYSVAEERILAKERVVMDFYFYLSLEQGSQEEELLEVLQNAKREEKPFFIGPRASQGLNLFRIKDILPIKLPNGQADYYLNLGMLLPEGVNFEKSYMNYFTSERKPYHQAGGWDKKQIKKYISYITPGSLLCLESNKRKAGKCVRAGYDNHSIIYGNAMLYPLPYLK